MKLPTPTKVQFWAKVYTEARMDGMLVADAMVWAKCALRLRHPTDRSFSITLKRRDHD